MRILQEYEAIRRELGPFKYQFAVEEYLFEYPEHQMHDLYYGGETSECFIRWCNVKLDDGYEFDKSEKPDSETAKRRYAANHCFDHYLICTRLADNGPEMETSASAAAAVLYFASSLGIYNERQHAALLKKLHAVMHENPNYKVYPERKENGD